MARPIRARRSGFTLGELIVGAGAGALLIGALASTMFFAGRSLDHGGAAAVQTKQAGDAVDDIAHDLRHATSFTERTAQAVTFTVPDRNGDGNAETIRYAWSGTAGNPLQVTHNGGAAAAAAKDVRGLNLSYLTRSVTGGGFVKGYLDDPALVAHWKLDDGAGLAANDTTANDNDGTLTNGPAWAAGRLGGALRFDGTDDYVSVPHKAVLSLTSEITITAWIYPADVSGRRVILNKGDGAGQANYQLELYDGRLTLWFRTGPWISVASPNTLPAGQWRHIAATMAVEGSDRRFRLYEDGVEAASQLISRAPVGNSGTLQLGRWSTVGRYFNGSLDDVRIYNRTLSAADIVQVMNGVL